MRSVARKEVGKPDTAGVFVDPGHKGSTLPAKPGWKPAPENRSVEYDTLSGDYAKFLMDEILPAVAKDHPFTGDPEGHAICGMSSGGICAFTAAWQRPDQYRKVVFYKRKRTPPTDKELKKNINRLKNHLKHNDPGTNSPVTGFITIEAGDMILRALRNYEMLYKKLPPQKEIREWYDDVTL